MHPPRREKTPRSPTPSTADRLVDWLLGHCPFSTLAILTVLVISPLTGPVPNPALVAVPVVVADLALLLMRRWVA